MPVTTVGAENIVIFAEVGANTGRHRFLPDIKMNGTYYLWLGADKFRYPFLKPAYPQHGHVKRFEGGRRDVRRLRGSGAGPPPYSIFILSSRP